MWNLPVNVRQEKFGVDKDMVWSISTQSFFHFPLSPITDTSKSSYSWGFQGWWQVVCNLSPHLSPITYHHQLLTHGALSAAYLLQFVSLPETKEFPVEKQSVSHRETIRFTPENFFVSNRETFLFQNRDETIRLKPASLLLYILQEKGSRRRIRHKKRN